MNRMGDIKKKRKKGKAKNKKKKKTSLVKKTNNDLGPPWSWSIPTRGNC